MTLWDELRNLITSGRYVPMGEEPRQYYCTNIIDAQLCGALDTLHTLDEGAAKLMPSYESIFIAPSTDYKCQCHACHPSENL